MNTKEISRVLYILGGAILIAVFFYLIRPTVEKESPAPPIPLVKVVTVAPTTEKIEITAFGVVEADDEVTIFPQVSGNVIEKSPHLSGGGKLTKGERLLQIDPEDFELRVQAQSGEVAKAVSQIKLEEGRRIVAKREWEMLKNTVDLEATNEDLVLREPQLKEREADLRIAKSRLEQAKLDLSRTAIPAPFEAMVVSQNAEIGQYVTPQTPVAKIVATKKFQVKATVSYKDLHWIALPTNGEDGQEVTVTLEGGGEDLVVKKGMIGALLPNVDEQGRLAILVIEIDNPLEGSPLLIGSYVKLTIPGKELQEVYQIPRDAVRDGGQVWVIDEKDELEIKTVEILFGNPQSVFLREGLQAGERVITSPLPLPIPGMKLRVDGDAS